MGAYCRKVQDEHDSKLGKFINDSELNLDNIRNRNEDITSSVGRLKAAQKNVQLNVAADQAAQGEQGDGDANPYSSRMTQGGPVQGGGYIDHVHSLPTHIKDLVMQHGVPALNNAMYRYAYPQSNDLREAALMKNMTEPNWASSMFGAGAEDEYGFIDGGNWPSNRRAPSGIGPKGPGEAGGYGRPHMSEKEQKAKMDREKLRGSICGHTITGWMHGDSAQKCGGLDACDKVAADSYKTGMNNYEAKARGEIDEMRDAQHHSLSQNLADARAQNQLNLARAQAQAPGGPSGRSPYN